MEHLIDASLYHHAWNREREPTLRIAGRRRHGAL